MAPVESHGIDHAVGDTEQLLATVLTSVIAAVSIIAVLALCRRQRIYWPLLVLVSGTATFLLEPLFDLLYGLWFFSEGQWTAVETYGIHVPIWLPIIYVFFYGAWTVWLVLRFQRGASLREVAVLFLASGVIAGLLETLYIQVFDLYVYQDSQPLSISGYPVWVALVNGVPPFLAAIVYVRLVPVLRGWENLALLFVVPTCFAAEFGEGWLYLAARHGSEDPSMFLLSVLALLTTALCFGLILCAARLAGIDRMGPAGSPEPVEGRRAATEPESQPGLARAR
jgi:hypothetical protein